MAGSPDAEEPPREGGFSLWRRPRPWWLFGVPAGGFLLFLVGVAAVVGFNGFTDYSNTLAFCTSCHEMKENMLPEYLESPHYKNAAGVRAVCSDCHVPHAFIPKMEAKIYAMFNEVPNALLRTVRDKDKFAAARLKMAKHVWARMKGNNSLECRNCHSLDAMKLADQDSSAQKKHLPERMAERGETCIDCHKGVGHGLPPGYAGED